MKKDLEFQFLVQEAMDKGITESLCAKFDLGPHQKGSFGYNTVMKWATGTAQPLPRFKKMIVLFIEKKLK